MRGENWNQITLDNFILIFGLDSEKCAGPQRVSSAAFHDCLVDWNDITAPFSAGGDKFANKQLLARFISDPCLGVGSFRTLVSATRLTKLLQTSKKITFALKKNKQCDSRLIIPVTNNQKEATCWRFIKIYARKCIAFIMNETLQQNIHDDNAEKHLSVLLDSCNSLPAGCSKISLIKGFSWSKYPLGVKSSDERSCFSSFSFFLLVFCKE